jgi:hypothetical protein
MDPVESDPTTSHEAQSIELLVSYSHCPYLGTEADRATTLAFPDYANRCHRHGKSVTVSVIAQEDLCLTSDYATCNVYREPERIPSTKKRFKRFSRPVRALTMVAVVVLILLAAFVWWPNPGKSILESTTFGASLSESVGQISGQEVDVATIFEPIITSTHSFFERFLPSAPAAVPTPSPKSSDATEDFRVIPYRE